MRFTPATILPLLAPVLAATACGVETEFLDERGGTADTVSVTLGLDKSEVGLALSQLETLDFTVALRCRPDTGGAPTTYLTLTAASSASVTAQLPQSAQDCRFQLSGVSVNGDTKSEVVVLQVPRSLPYESGSTPDPVSIPFGDGANDQLQLQFPVLPSPVGSTGFSERVRLTGTSSRDLCSAPFALTDPAPACVQTLTIEGSTVSSRLTLGGELPPYLTVSQVSFARVAGSGTCHYEGTYTCGERSGVGLWSCEYLAASGTLTQSGGSSVALNFAVTQRASGSPATAVGSADVPCPQASSAYTVHARVTSTAASGGTSSTTVDGQFNVNVNAAGAGTGTATGTSP